MKKGVDYIGVAVGAMVFNQAGQVLIAHRGPKAKNESGKWEFPGGSVEMFESLEEAIHREIREEFGIEVKIVEMLDVVDHILKEENQHWIGIAYIAEHISGELQLKEPEKIDAAKWVNLTDLDQYTLTKPTQSNLIAYYRK